MKTKIITKTLLLSALIFVGQTIFAQSNTTGKEDAQKYRLYLVKDENGNKEVIDKTFTSKEDMDAYMKQNRIDVPEASDVPTPTPPPTPPKVHGSKHGNGEGEQKEKKVIIIEKEEGSINGNPDLEITYKDLTAEERATIIQELLNQKGNQVQIVHPQRGASTGKGNTNGL